MNTDSGPERIQALDGLRAVSIGFVLLSHASTAPGWPGGFLPEDIRPAWTNWLGPLGVDIFFCISGFIITHLLLAERERTSSVSVGRFYLRRCLRILPPLLAYLAFVGYLAARGWIEVPESSAWAAISFTSNFSWAGESPHLGHLWSLAIEEQFYLVWPWLLAVLRPSGAAIRALAWATILPIPIAALSLANLLPEWMQAVRFDAAPIAAGCLLAFLYRYRPERLNALYAHRLAPTVLILTAIAVIAVQQISVVAVIFRSTIEGLAAALFIGYLLIEDSWLRRLLCTRPFVFVGSISYSLYLWQQIFLNDHLDAWSLQLGSVSERIVLAVGAAVISYYAVERPLMNQRSKMRIR